MPSASRAISRAWAKSRRYRRRCARSVAGSRSAGRRFATKRTHALRKASRSAMDDPCTEALARRDPETLLGPLLWLLTRLARRDETSGELACAVVAHSTALAAHPGVPLELRLAAGAL